MSSDDLIKNAFLGSVDDGLVKVMEIGVGLRSLFKTGFSS